MLSRRQLLQRLALGLGVVACRTSLAQPVEKAVYIGIETNPLNNLSLSSFFSATGERIATLILDYRAHGMADSANVVVIFPRRPGNRFSVVNKETLAIHNVVTAPKGVHFNGHGAFSRDGKYLFVTENQYGQGRGAVGVYEISDTVSRVDELLLPIHGPHEIVRHPTADTFYVALGGLYTHPEYGREPLNLHTFKSQIVQLNPESSSIVEMGVWPDSAGVSLQHLAVDENDRLYIGGQIKSVKRAANSNVLWLVENGNVKPIDHREDLLGYVSSVSATKDYALISSKESGVVLRLSGSSLIDKTHLEGAGSVSATDKSCAKSGYKLLELNDTELNVLEGYEFDSHGLLLS